MKKLKLILGVTLLFALFGTISQCRKGENDPLISLRSRKARVAGEWKMTSGTAMYVNRSTNYSSTSNYNFTNNSYSNVSTTTFGSNTTSTNKTGTFEYKITFEKDGTFTLTNSMGTEITTLKGKWNFTGSVGDVKKKEQIILTLSSETYQASSTTSNINSYTTNQVYRTFNIKELRNKKLVLVSEESTTSSGGSQDSSTEEYTFEQ